MRERERERERRLERRKKDREGERETSDLHTVKVSQQWHPHEDVHQGGCGSTAWKTNCRIVQSWDCPVQHNTLETVSLFPVV